MNIPIRDSRTFKCCFIFHTKEQPVNATIYFVGGGVVLFFQFVITAVTAPVSFEHDQPSLTTATQQSALAGNVYESPSITRSRDTNGAPARRTAKVI